MEDKLNEFDIIVNHNNEILQYLGKEFEDGAIVQDIHCKKELIPNSFIVRKANKDEIKWFCESTENNQFTPPNSSIR